MEQQFLVLTIGGQINRQPVLSFSGKSLLTRRKLLMISRETLKFRLSVC